jgi:DNA processing protein
MLTVDQAARRGVPVLAVPGSLRNRAAEGTNRLISDGCQPATDSADVLVALGLERCGQMRFPAAVRPRPAANDRTLLDLIGTDAVQIDELVRLSDLTLVEVALGLGRLEADGWVMRTGSWFERAVDGVSTFS